MTAEQYIPDDDENPEFLRHKSPLEVHDVEYYEYPYRWYKINTHYVSSLIALCDYYTHEDAHAGTSVEQISGVQRWESLQQYLMWGEYTGGAGVHEEANPFCEQVNECLESGDLNGSIQNIINNISYGGDASTTTMTAPAAKVNLVYDCDPDLMYGAMTQMVDLFHRLILDFLENAVALTNWAQKVEYSVSSIPLIGSLPFDEQIGFIAIAVENIQENYAASYNEGLRNDYICDLFCLALDGCEISLFGMAKYFGLAFWKDITEITWLDLIEYLLEGIFSGTELVHFIHTILAFSLAAGAEFLGISGDLLTAMVKSFYNDPDSDWETLCDACEVGSSVLFFFPESHYGFTILPDFKGSWESGEGFTVYGSPDTSTYGVGIRKIFNELYNITKIKFTAEFRWGDESNVTRYHSVSAFANEEEKKEVAAINGGFGRVYHRTLEVFPDLQTNAVEATGKAGSQGGGSYVKIRSIEVWFAGDLPTEFEGIS